MYVIFHGIMHVIIYMIMVLVIEKERLESLTITPVHTHVWCQTEQVLFIVECEFHIFFAAMNSTI